MKEQDALEQRIKQLIEGNSIVLFMKGTPEHPRCGFSETVVRVLQAMGVEFAHVDVLEDEEIRSGIKAFSQWPTIPQLYVGGSFVGGCDIVREEYASGLLQNRLSVES